MFILTNLHSLIIFHFRNLMLSNPQKALPNALDLLERMRGTYKKRTEFRIALVRILIKVHFIYYAIGNHEKVVDIGWEILDFFGEPLKYFFYISVSSPIIKAYKAMGRLDLAKKYALEAFKCSKTIRGTTLEVFKLEYPSFAEFLPKKERPSKILKKESHASLEAYSTPSYYRYLSILCCILAVLCVSIIGFMLWY